MQQMITICNTVECYLKKQCYSECKHLYCLTFDTLGSASRERKKVEDNPAIPPPSTAMVLICAVWVNYNQIMTITSSAINMCTKFQAFH